MFLFDLSGTIESAPVLISPAIIRPEKIRILHFYPEESGHLAKARLQGVVRRFSGMLVKPIFFKQGYPLSLVKASA